MDKSRSSHEKFENYRKFIISSFDKMKQKSFKSQMLQKRQTIRARFLKNVKRKTEV